MATMRRCLDEFEIGPMPTTIPMHRAIFDHEHFQSAQIDTGFIERNWKNGLA